MLALKMVVFVIVVFELSRDEQTGFFCCVYFL
jgi:hypothetical protein